MEPEDGALVPDELIDPSAIEEQEESPGQQEQQALTEDERREIAAEYLRKNPPQYQQQQQQQQVVDDDDDDDGELPDDATVADLIRKEVSRAVKGAIRPLASQLGELIPAQADVSRASVVSSIASEYALTREEVEELRLFANNIKSPVHLARALSDPDVRKTMAAQARGMASFSSPPKPATAARPDSKIRFAPGVTEGDIRKYMQFQGITALGKQHIEELTKSGHIVRK